MENGQVRDFLAYVSGKGRIVVDEELYLPKGRLKGERRRKWAEALQDVRFHTKPEIVLGMISQAAEGPPPFRWAACDDRYGQNGQFRDGLDELDSLYMATSGPLAWLGHFRGLRIRYERRAEIHEAFLSIGCALTCWNVTHTRYC